MRIIILFGKPGAGKGTMIDKFLEEKGDLWTSVSTGSIIRNAIKSGTELGLKAKAYADSGKLAPDEIIVPIVKEALEELEDTNVEGVFLDGFPRTVAQAKMMKELNIIPDRVFDLYVEDEEVILRLSKRRVCPNCGKTYSTGTYNHPKVEWICDDCGNDLIKRKDDAPDVVRERLKVFAKETGPVVQTLEEMGFTVEPIFPDSVLAEII